MRQGNSDGELLTSWDEASGRIPIVWTDAVATIGVEDDDYESFLRGIMGGYEKSHGILCGL